MVQITESPDDLHQRKLKSICRVCGQSLKPSRTLYICEDHQENLLAVFHINVADDRPEIHPCYFCEKCRAVVQKSEKAAKEMRVYTLSVRVYNWTGHDHQCTICSPSLGGRPRKQRKNRGRPSLTPSFPRLIRFLLLVSYLLTVLIPDLLTHSPNQLD